MNHYLALFLLLTSTVFSPSFADEVIADEDGGLLSKTNYNVATIEGITEAKDTATLSFPDIGRIAKVLVKEGELVTKGKTLLKLVNEAEKIDVKLRKLTWLDKSELESAKAQREIYLSIYNNAKKLYNSSGSISGDELKQRQAQYLLYEAQCQQLAVIEQQEKMEYELALERLSRKVLKAPFSGVVTQIFVHEGESIERNNPVIKLVDFKQGLFVMNVEENIGRTLRQGQAVTLNILAGEGSVERSGEIVFVSPMVDSASNLVKSKVLFSNDDGKIKLGVAGTANIELSTLNTGDE